MKTLIQMCNEAYLIAMRGALTVCSTYVNIQYISKALLALRQYVQRGYFPPGTRLVMLHSGGLQGVRALQTDDRQGCNPQEARDE